MKAFRFDLYVLCVSVAAAIAAFGWYGVVQIKTSRPKADRRPAGTAENPYRKAEYAVEKEIAANWLPPLPQRGSKEWVFDLFTPPEIYYDASAKRFSVSPPKTSRERDAVSHRVATTPLDGIQLRSVSPGLFRLQLVGFFRSPSSDFGLFQNVATGETFLAARGRVVSALGLIVESIHVGPERIAGSEDSLVKQTIATAIIKDQQTGTLIELSTNERSFAASARARLEIADAPSSLREVASGDSLELNGEQFAVIEVRLSPPSITLSRLKAGASSNECFTLECHDAVPSGTETPSA